MAKRLVANGHPLKAFDPDLSKVATGAIACRTPAEASADADIVALMVATPAQGEQALFGPGGAVESLAPGTQVIVFSTVGPRAVREWADRLTAVSVVDAPVSGGVARAAAGELVIFAAGRRPEADQILSALATTITDAGPEPGAGQLVKLVNQLLCGVHIAVAAEALDYADALGLDPRTVWTAVRQGAAGSFMLNDRGERMLNAPPAVTRSAVDIFVKDLGLVRDEARRVGSHTPLADAAKALFEEAAATGLGSADDSQVIEMIRRHRQ
jgi:3-hydroxyisobutyrate dehydrogenase/putative dehydrogenase